MHVCYWWEGQKERDHYRGQDIGERGILRYWGDKVG
jgi:hypothetical protein